MAMRIIGLKQNGGFATHCLVEDEKFLVDIHDHDLAYFQEPKATPSGWWPTKEWIQACVDKPRKLKP